MCIHVNVMSSLFPMSPVIGAAYVFACVCIYIYMYTCICVCVYMCIYIYICWTLISETYFFWGYAIFDKSGPESLEKEIHQITVNHVKILKGQPVDLPFRSWYKPGAKHFHLTIFVKWKSTTQQC